MPARAVRHDEIELVRHAERGRHLKQAAALRLIADRALDLRRLVADDNASRLEHAHARSLASLVHGIQSELHRAKLTLRGIERSLIESATRESGALGCC